MKQREHWIFDVLREGIISGTIVSGHWALRPPFGMWAPKWERCRLPAVLCNMLNSRGSPCVCLKLTGVPLKPWLPLFRTAIGTQRTTLGSGTLQGTPIIKARTQTSLFVLKDMSTHWTTPSVKPINQSAQRGILIGVGQTDFVTKLQRKLSSWMFTLSNPWPGLQGPFRDIIMLHYFEQSSQAHPIPQQGIQDSN